MEAVHKATKESKATDQGTMEGFCGDKTDRIGQRPVRLIVLAVKRVVKEAIVIEKRHDPSA